ncbi:hypothetical protein ABZV31_06070 [Streptomyces sp. NPDC005202]|uniref:hypothetical protein n=1 Tax=Streptomyces sp. NPDC005202 TaxID=3157021 RepID=UPI0033BE2CE8
MTALCPSWRGGGAAQIIMESGQPVISTGGWSAASPRAAGRQRQRSGGLYDLGPSDVG